MNIRKTDSEHRYLQSTLRCIVVSTPRLPPDYMKVADVADDITGSGDREKAIQAIRKTALDDFSPVVFVRGSNQQVVSFGKGHPDQIKQEAHDWITQWDESELPDGLE